MTTDASSSIRLPSSGPADSNVLHPLMVDVEAGGDDHLVVEKNHHEEESRKDAWYHCPSRLGWMVRMAVITLIRVWSPWTDVVVRLMLVATFFDDSWHTALDFSSHAEQISQGFPRALQHAPISGRDLAVVSLFVGLTAQFVGATSLLLSAKDERYCHHPDLATRALLGWTVVQPVLYAQLSNGLLVAESLTLVGGLLLLRAQTVPGPRRHTALLLGRLLLPAMYLYYALGVCWVRAATWDETDGARTYALDLSESTLWVAAVLLLATGSVLVAAGLRSRRVAWLSALANVVWVCHEHPFWRYVSYEQGQWIYSDTTPIPRVVLPRGYTALDFEPWQLYDLHRYYFFLGLSTSGALLLLARFGPGEMAVQNDELLLSETTMDKGED